MFWVRVSKEKTKEEKFVCSNLTGECSGDELPLREREKQDWAEAEVRCNRSFTGCHMMLRTCNAEQPFRLVLDQAIRLSLRYSPASTSHWTWSTSGESL